MKVIKNQRGFSAVELVLVLGVVVVVAMVGWFVFSKDNKKQEETTNSTPAVSTTTESTKTPVNNEGYFVISQWGVRAKDDSDLTLEYEISKDSLGEYAIFTSAELKKFGGTCADGGGATIGRHKKGTNINSFGDVSLVENEPGAVKVGDYYYVSVSGGGTCGETDAANDMQQKTRDAIGDIKDALQAIPQQ